ncbi:MAG TPA: DUF456 domain-containing protein [Gemmatimonadales bacterium]|nr:DUF456 domain-containing protein [Gemmatimonadales bacterium]
MPPPAAVPDPRWLLAILLVGTGVLGTVVPALPGAPLVLAGLFVAAWIDGFREVGWFTLTILSLITLVTVAIDLGASAVGAQRVRASRLALVGATLGTVVGFFFGVPGLLLGPFLGAAAGEYLARRDLRRAGKVGFATWLGLIFAAAAKLAIVFTMLGIFAIAYAI